MVSISSFLKRHLVLAYFALTFLLTWGTMFLVIGSSGFPISPEQFETSGGLVYMAMLIGPSASGLLLILFANGKAGFKDFLSRLFKWKVEVRWYLLALLTAPLVAMAILVILSLMSPEYLPGIFTVEDKFTHVLTWLGVGLMVGFFEELGWTGFVVPEMRKQQSVLMTGLVVGFVWGLWHFLPFWEADTFSRTFPFVLLLARLFFWLPPYRVLMVHLYDHTESLFIVILMHAVLVATLQVVVPVNLVGGQLLTWLIVWAIALWVLVTAVVFQWQAVDGHKDESLMTRKTI